MTHILHYITPANVAAALHLRLSRRLTIRHVLLVLGISVILSTSYYTYLGRSRVSLSPEDVLLWPPEMPDIWSGRAAQVREAFRHAYHGYEQFAFPHDELLSVSNRSVDNFNGWGVTAVDSLDALLLMGFEDEYMRAMSLIREINYSLPTNTMVSFFETVIRYLGGLLSAYAITGHDVLREKADELGTILSPAFNTTSGLPAPGVDTYGGKTLSLGSNTLADMASYQMEYAYLGKITGKKDHVDHALGITNAFYNANLIQTGGMYPTKWDLESGTPADGLERNHVTTGASADSGHEYTLKQFLLTARTDKRNLEMYLRFTSYVINNLLFITPNRQLLYVTDAHVLGRSVVPTHNFEHLSCFLPGLFALGVHFLPLDHLATLCIDFVALADNLSPVDRQAYARLAEFNLADLHLWAAKGIAQTCYLTYADQPTGLGPETVRMEFDPDEGGIRWIDALRAWKKEQGGFAGWWRSGLGRAGSLPPGMRDMTPWMNPLSDNVTVEALVRPGRKKSKGVNTHGRDYLVKSAAYYLRPETVESFYILWQTTGDVKWRHLGWHIFQAIQRHAKTASGYSSVDNVHTVSPAQTDSMPSYFLAETLKYLYLLFSDDDPFPLDKWVYNTEAHPLPVFEWTKEEREAYGIV